MNRSLPIRSLLRRAAAAALLLGLLPACTPSQGAALSGPNRWWNSYGGSYANTRHLDLDQIRPDNVGSLRLAWKFDTGLQGQFETSPVVVDGTMYFTTGQDNGAFAVDAATGAQKWHYVPKSVTTPYIFTVNRGVAVDGGRVFYTTLDDRLIALDAKTGKFIWEKSVGDPKAGMRENAAPLAWGGLVFVGSSGGEYGVRGSYSAYSQKDGGFAWRWWTVGPGWEGPYRTTAQGYSLHRDIARERADAKRYADSWKNGGGAIWMTPALSPHDATIYLSTGNPAPCFHAERRPGDNLYTDSIVALDAHSGKMKWYYQETPHDVWDYDASSPPVLVDALDNAGRRVPAVAEAGKTGWLYVVDRKTGTLLRTSQPFVPQPHMYNPLSKQGEAIQPGDLGGAIGPIAYDPAKHSAFVAGDVQLETGTVDDTLEPWKTNPVNQWTGGDMTESGSQHEAGTLTSIDVDTGRARWSTPVGNLVFGGVLSTNGLVFLGEQGGGFFKAYDAESGKILWRVNPGDQLTPQAGIHARATRAADAAQTFAMSVWHRLHHQPDYGTEDIHAPPIAYQMNGREYIVIASNVFGRQLRPGGDEIFAFSLP